MNFTKNFTYEELIKSGTAKRLGINNTPNEAEKAELRKLCEDVLQPIRDSWGKPIIVSSGFRCKKLNEKVNGATKSQHLLGKAADIHTLSDTAKENKELFNHIRGMIERGEIVVGQLIDEYGYDWIHVSSTSKEKKNQILHLG